MDYSISQINIDNIDDCANILQKEYNSNELNEGWTIESAVRTCRFYFQLQPDLFYIAKCEGDNEVIGFVFAFIKPWSHGNCFMLEEICVSREYRRQGVAKNLLKHIIENAISKYNIVSIKAETYGSEKKMPYSWYKRLGLTKDTKVYGIVGNPQEILKQL